VCVLSGERQRQLDRVRHKYVADRTKGPSEDVTQRSKASLGSSGRRLSVGQPGFRYLGGWKGKCNRNA